MNPGLTKFHAFELGIGQRLLRRAGALVRWTTSNGSLMPPGTDLVDG